MPSFRRRASATDTDHVEKPADTVNGAGDDAADDAVDDRGVDALTLAEEAEAEAAEAEALAAAARARARAIRLRREAEEAEEAKKAKEASEAEADTTAAAAAVEAEEDTAADSETVVAEPDETAEADSDEKDVDQKQGDKDATEKEEAAPSKRRWGLVVKIAAMTVAILCTVALLAASGYMIVQHRKETDLQQLNAEYVAAGRQSVVTLMSLDFNKAQEDVDRIIANSTGQFKTDFENQAEDFVKVAQESKVVTDVTITAAAVESMTPDSAVVLVAATSRVTNAAGAKQEPRAWRLSVNLERVDGGQVKMSKVEFVP